MQNSIIIPNKGTIVIYGENEEILFKGLQTELIRFIYDSMYMAECIEADIEGEEIVESDTNNIAFNVYKNFTKYNANNLGYVSLSNSDKLLEQANQEDNDLKYMGLFKKAQREKRWETFQENVLPILEEREVGYRYNEEKYSYTFSSSVHGLVVFYVKANKIHIVRNNKWIQGNTMEWLFKYIINK